MCYSWLRIPRYQSVTTTGEYTAEHQYKQIEVDPHPYLLQPFNWDWWNASFHTNVWKDFPRTSKYNSHCLNSEDKWRTSSTQGKAPLPFYKALSIFWSATFSQQCTSHPILSSGLIWVNRKIDTDLPHRILSSDFCFCETFYYMP